MDAAAAIRLARRRANLSKRELARRAGTSPAAVVQYERGDREPTYPTLRRMIGAAGYEAELTIRPARRPPPEELGRRLVQVLDLVEYLPRRGRTPSRLPFPRFPK